MIAYQNPFQRWLWESGAVYIIVAFIVALILASATLLVYDHLQRWKTRREIKTQRKEKNL